MTKTTGRTLGALVAAASIVTGSAALAGATESIKARQGAMKTVGAEMKALSAIAKKEKPFDAAAVGRSAETIAASLKTAASHFPAGSEKGDVAAEARPEIWTDAAGFAAAFKTAGDAAAGMAAVKDEAGFMPALKALGGSCKGCHDKFRLAKP